MWSDKLKQTPPHLNGILFFNATFVSKHTSSFNKDELSIGPKQLTKKKSRNERKQKKTEIK